MKRRSLLIILGGLGLVACVIAVELTIERGFSVRDEPNFVDALVARWWRRLAVPRDERSVVNPLPATPQVILRGREHFAADCAACHGSDGRGDTPLGRGLYPRPPDLSAVATQSLGDGEIFWVIQNGVRLSGMPAWTRAREEHGSSTWELVHFIRQLPRLSEKDLAAVEAMRPRSPRQIGQDEAARLFLGEGDDGNFAAADAHDEASLMGTIAAVDAVRLQVRTTAGASVSFLLDHSGPTKILRGRQPVGPARLQIGDRVVVRAVRDQDWWLAREVLWSGRRAQP